jgi:hypothetical protein
LPSTGRPVGVARAKATVTVASATGASPEAVRAALPVASYKDCYQRALAQAKEPLEGHAELKAAFLPSGFFSGAQGFANTELAKVGQCCVEATLSSPRAIQNVSAAGGTADITIVFALE